MSNNHNYPYNNNYILYNPSSSQQNNNPQIPQSNNQPHKNFDNFKYRSDEMDVEMNINENTKISSNSNNKNFTNISKSSDKSKTSNNSSNNIRQNAPLICTNDPNMEIIKEEENITMSIEDNEGNEKSQENKENKENLIYKKICQKHAIDLANNPYYEDNINELLKEMDCFGQISKKKIKKINEKRPKDFFLITDSFSKCKPLAILQMGLQSIKCTCEIEKKEATSDDEKNEAFTALQFIMNGLFNLTKYIFKFKSIYEGEYNIEILSHYISQLFGINKNDVVINTFFEEQKIISVIIKNSNNNNKILNKDVSEIQLYLSSMLNIEIESIEKEILLNGCKLNTIILDKNKIINNNIQQNKQNRGGKIYYPPNKWLRYGLNLFKRYDNGNDNWCDPSSKNQWCIAYHGINNSEKNFFLTTKPEILEKFCKEIKYDGKNYKIGFMCRIKPDKINNNDSQNDDYWIINGTDNEIRPYRILLLEY